MIIQWGHWDHRSVLDVIRVHLHHGMLHFISSRLLVHNPIMQWLLWWSEPLQSYGRSRIVHCSRSFGLLPTFCWVDLRGLVPTPAVLVQSKQDGWLVRWCCVWLGYPRARQSGDSGVATGRCHIGSYVWCMERVFRESSQAMNLSHRGVLPGYHGGNTEHGQNPPSGCCTWSTVCWSYYSSVCGVIRRLLGGYVAILQL